MRKGGRPRNFERPAAINRQEENRKFSPFLWPRKIYESMVVRPTEKGKKGRHPSSRNSPSPPLLLVSTHPLPFQPQIFMASPFEVLTPKRKGRRRSNLFGYCATLLLSRNRLTPISALSFCFPYCRKASAFKKKKQLRNHGNRLCRISVQLLNKRTFISLSKLANPLPPSGFESAKAFSSLSLFDARRLRRYVTWIGT